MNKASSLLVLVRSMTRAEKRYFKLYSNIQKGDKLYMKLFDLIEECSSVEEVAERFAVQTGGGCFEMAVKHLYKQLIDTLTHLRSRNDIRSRIFARLSEADILFRCGLVQAALDELAHAKKTAQQHELYALLLQIRQTELRYMEQDGFMSLNEKGLVEKQMKINRTLNYLRYAAQHMQLYEILKYRSLHQTESRSEHQRQSLNDLVLSELNIVSNNSYRGFEVDKLHQLFQSTYFLQSGNYKVAIRAYLQLLELFDENPKRMLNPPTYYLDAITGMLDTLQLAGLHAEMPLFIGRLRQLAEGEYAADFLFGVSARVFLYEFSRCIGLGDIAAAEALYEASEASLFRRMAALSLDLQLLLSFDVVILHLICGRLREARKAMARILGTGQVLDNFPIYRIIRLLNLLLQAESGHLDYIENEIKSVRRSALFEKNSSEKLIFRFVRAFPLTRERRARLWQRMRPEIEAIETDPYERPLLKYFDFMAWIEHRLTDVSLADILFLKTHRLNAPARPTKNGDS